MFKDLKRIKKLSNTVFGISLLLFAVACEDDHDHDHDEHLDAEGFILENSSGAQVYKEFKGTSQGTITVTAGATLELTVHFLGDDGKELEHEEHGDEDEEGGIMEGWQDSLEQDYPSPAGMHWQMYVSDKDTTSSSSEDNPDIFHVSRRDLIKYFHSLTRLESS